MLALTPWKLDNFYMPKINPELYSPDLRIEDLIALEMLEENNNPSFLGLAVTVETVCDDVAGIYTTHQSRSYAPLNTTLDMYRKPKESTKGSIFALDKNHNTLWLRPQRLSQVAINAGFIAIPNFVTENESPAFSVKVRKPTRRDATPFINMIAVVIPGMRSQRYEESGMPVLAYEDWHFIDVQSL